MEKRKNQGQEWEDEEVIDLGEIFYALLRKLWVIIAVAVLGAGIGGAIQLFSAHTAVQLNGEDLCTDERDNADLVSRSADRHAADTGLQDDHHRSFRYGRGG